MPALNRRPRALGALLICRQQLSFYATELLLKKVDPLGELQICLTAIFWFHCRTPSTSASERAAST